MPDDLDRTWPPRLPPLLDEGLLARVAAAVPARGDLERLEKIGWWGAVVCWTAADSDTDQSTYRAAAAFNVGVAVFDSVLDRGGERSATLVAALAPHHLHRVLLDPAHQTFGSVPAECEPVTELFRISLAGFAGRWGDNRDQMSLAIDLLTEMYRSEVGELADPLPAKSLPSVFLGLFGSSEKASVDMHRELGLFLATWDDWMDLDEDLLARRPNLFLGVPRGWGVVGYVLRGLRFVVAGGAEVTRQALCDHLSRAIEAARHVAPPARSRTMGFVEALLR